MLTFVFFRCISLSALVCKVAWFILKMEELQETPKLFARDKAKKFKQTNKRKKIASDYCLAGKKTQHDFQLNKS